MNCRFQRERLVDEDTRWNDCVKKIWHPDYAVYYENPRNQLCYFRKTFELREKCLKSDLRIIADTKYQIFINGHFLGRGPCRFDIKWALYDFYDIAPYLVEGENLIAVSVLFHGYGTGAQVSNIQMLMVQAELEFESGKVDFIPSDSSWKTRTAPHFDSRALRINGRQGPMEVQDLNLYDPQWSQTGFDDEDWENSAEINLSPWWNIGPRKIPILQEELFYADKVAGMGYGDIPRPLVSEMGEPRESIEWEKTFKDKLPLEFELETTRKPLVVNIDFSLIMAGYLEMTLETTEVATVDVLYAEELFNNVVPRAQGSRIAQDRFILKSGKNICEVSFGWKAFRYVQLWIWGSSKCTLNKIACRRITYPVKRRKVWEDITDDFVLKIIELAENSLRLCMQDGFLDSSSREQQQWMGDGSTQALAAAYYYGETDLWRQMLYQMAQSQDYMGAMMPRHPGRHENIQPIPSFMLDWISSIWDYYSFTGEKRVLEDLWNNMVQLVRWFSPFENANGLLENVPYWNFIDWGGMDTERRGINTSLNCKYFNVLNIMLKVAKALNDGDAEFFYYGKGSVFTSALMSCCFNRKRGVFVDCVVDGIKSGVVSEATNSLALLYFSLNDDIRAKITKEVFGGYRTENDIVRSSPGFIINVGRALDKAGYKELALDLYKYRFEKMLSSGATAVWENWDLFFMENNKKYIHSASHGWGAGFLVFYAEAFLGVDKKGENNALR